MVEHSTADREVTGSNPVAPLLVIIFLKCVFIISYFKVNCLFSRDVIKF